MAEVCSAQLVHAIFNLSKMFVMCLYIKKGHQIKYLFYLKYWYTYQALLVSLLKRPLFLMHCYYTFKLWTLTAHKLTLCAPSFFPFICLYNNPDLSLSPSPVPLSTHWHRNTTVPTSFMFLSLTQPSVTVRHWLPLRREKKASTAWNMHRVLPTGEDVPTWFALNKSWSLKNNYFLIIFNFNYVSC